MRVRWTPDISNLQVASHRNGITGEPFIIATFEANTGDARCNFLAIHFPEKNVDGYYKFTRRTAVLQLDEVSILAVGHMHPGDLSAWRGDLYEDYLVPLLEEALARYYRSA